MHPVVDSLLINSRIFGWGYLLPKQRVEHGSNSGEEHV